VRGVALVGPIPRELQKLTTYSAGRPARAAPPELGRAFIAFLARSAFKTNLAAMGLDCRE
jgi:molybdate transport system substrate-binding protein